MSFSRTVKTGAGLAGGLPMSSKLDPVLKAIKAAEYQGDVVQSTKRKRWDMMVCQYCRQHSRLCPVCAGVL